MNDELKFHLTDEDGTTQEFEILTTVVSDRKIYAIYRDADIDEADDQKVFASILSTEGGHLRFLPIETAAEWTMIETVLENLRKEE